MIKKLTACLLVLMVAVAFMPASAFAASKTVKMKTFNHVIKSGTTAYCAGADAIYKVKLTKSGKVTKVTRIVKGNGVEFKDDRLIGHMKKKGNYVYYLDRSAGLDSVLYRVNVKTKKKKIIVSTMDGIQDYVIKKDKLYCKYYKPDLSYKLLKRYMKLNGSSKKPTSKKIVMKTWRSTTKGYYVTAKKSKGYVKSYLKTPKGSYYLGKTRLYEE